MNVLILYECVNLICSLSDCFVVGLLQQRDGEPNRNSVTGSGQFSWKGGGCGERAAGEESGMGEGSLSAAAAVPAAKYVMLMYNLIDFA